MNEVNIWFDFCAVWILIAVLFTFYLRKTIPVFQNRIFIAVVWMSLFATFFDLVTGMWQNCPEEAGRYFSPRVFELLNYGYFISRNAIPILYTFYIMSLLNIRMSTVKRSLLLYFPIFVDALLIALTPFTDAVFYVDAQGVYYRGNYLFIMYIVAAYYMALGVYFVFYYRSTMPLSRRLAFYSYVLIAAVTVCIQGLYPHLQTECFGTTLCILLIYMTIQRPEEILDGPTGLFNPTAFMTMLSVNFRRRSRFLVVVLIINNFSFLESSIGYSTVEKILSSISDYLKQFLKKTSIYRIADDRIALMVDSSDYACAEKILSSIEERFTREWKSGQFRIGFRIHDCIIRCPENADTPDKLYELIEILSKEAGRTDRIRLEVSSLDISGIKRARLVERSVNMSVKENALEVVYQPIFSVEKGRFVSAEALLRLKDRELGYIPPDEFIPVAEKNGMILEMGEFVLNSVCRFYRENELYKLGVDYIEVNLSVVECLQDNLAGKVLEVLSSYGLPPGRLNLEITETAMSTMPDTVENNIREMARRGISFSLDDYGTGYSNFTRVFSLPFSIIKLDKSIVQEAFVSESADIVLTSTVEMLGKLNKEVLAEGVETKEQSDRLKGLGCELLQGYYYARPLRPEAFVAALEEQGGQQSGS